MNFLRVRSSLIVLALAAPAHAQTPSAFAYWQNAAGVVLMPLGGPVPEWSASVGMGLAVVPRYEGDDHARIVPAPAFDLRYRDIAFLSAGDGIGVNLLRGDTYRAGIALGYDTGRNPHITERTQGLGNINASAVPRLYAEAAYLPFVFTADVRHPLGGPYGIVGDLGVYTPIVGTEKLVVFVGEGVTLANGKYMESYFGVDEQQALGSVQHLPFYAASGGLKDATFGVNAIYHFTDHWFVDGDVSYERLLASAAESPIVTSKDQAGVSIVLGYQF
jgi:outer membrane scaffolding protein for murein synthesis (MipA/OmpV family)